MSVEERHNRFPEGMQLNQNAYASFWDNKNADVRYSLMKNKNASNAVKPLENPLFM